MTSPTHGSVTMDLRPALGGGRARARWLALDVLRAVAVMSMIQGHTFTALLHPALYRGGWVQWHSLLHGLTAPMFLIGGGLAYGFVTFGSATAEAAEPGAGGGRWAVHGKRFRRGVLLIALGVCLQLPAASFAEILERPDMRANVLRAGALQLVGACLIVCEALWLAARTRRRFVWALAVLTFALAFASPLIWNARLSDRYALGTWLDGHAGSLFPLAPWAVFFFAGVLGWFANDALASIPAGQRARSRPHDAGSPARVPDTWRHFASASGLAGFGLSALCYLTYVEGVQLRALYGEHNFWHTSPLFVGFRAGLVFAWLGLLSSGERAIAWLWRVWPLLGQGFRLLARRSLVAYVVHLLLLYGTPFTAGLTRNGASFDFEQTSAFLFYVFAVTVAVVWLWDRYVAAFDWPRARARLGFSAAPDRPGW